MGGAPTLQAAPARWLAGLRRSPSPNCDLRPQGTEIDLLVLHSISLPPGEFGGRWIDDLFHNRLDAQAHPYFRTIAGLRVSARFCPTTERVSKVI